QLPDSPFGHVILPGDAVLVQEREETVAVAVEPLSVCFGYFGAVIPPSDVPLIEPLHFPVELPQVPGLQSEAIDGPKDRDEQRADLHGECLQLLVERSLPEVIVDVADEVDEALLLPAWDAVVAGIEVAHQDAPVAGQHLADDVGFPRLGHPENDMAAVGEH